MLHVRTAIEYGAAASAAIAPTLDGVDRLADESYERRRAAAERALDEVLAESFPASDPPSWNPGIARPGPPQPVTPYAHRSYRSRHPADSVGESHTSGVSRPSSVRTFLHGVVSLVGASLIALLLPLVILLVGLPVVLVVRGMLEMIGLLVGVNLR